MSRRPYSRSDLQLSDLEGKATYPLDVDDDLYRAELIEDFRDSLRKEQTEYELVQRELERLEDYRYDTLRHCNDTCSKLNWELEDRQADFQARTKRAKIAEQLERSRIEALKSKLYVDQKKRISDFMKQRDEIEGQIEDIRKEMQQEENKYRKKKAQLTQAMMDIKQETEAMENKKQNDIQKLDDLHTELDKLKHKFNILSAKHRAETKRLNFVSRDYDFAKADYELLKDAEMHP